MTIKSGTKKLDAQSFLFGFRSCIRLGEAGARRHNKRRNLSTKKKEEAATSVSALRKVGKKGQKPDAEVDIIGGKKETRPPRAPIARAARVCAALPDIQK